MNPTFWAIAVSRQEGSDADGMHLLWTAPYQAGYSVKGYDIQRRESRHRPEITCYTLTPQDLQTLHRDLRVSTPIAIVGARRTRCPQTPEKPPDEPYLDCLDLGVLTPERGSNPRTERGMTFDVRDHTGNRAPNTLIQTIGGLRGLNCGHALSITLPARPDWVEMTIVHFALPSRIRAFNSDGSLAGDINATAKKGQPETISITGSSIERIILTAPQNETLLLRICSGKREKLSGREKECVDFEKSRKERGPNPLEAQDVSFEALDHEGNPLPYSSIQELKGFKGLDCGFEMRIKLPTGSSKVDLTLFHTATPAKIVAFNEDGTKAGTAVMADQLEKPEIITFTGTAIRRIVITAPQNETILLKLCFDKRPITTRPRAITADEMDRLIREDLHETAECGKSDPEKVGSGQSDFGEANLFDFTKPSPFAATSTLRAIAPPKEPACMIYDVNLGEPHAFVRVIIGVPFVLAIALREGKAVDTKSADNSSGMPEVIFRNRSVDRVLLYVGTQAQALTICEDIAPHPEKEEQEWRSVPFLAKGIQLPVRAVNSALGSASDERNLASSRLLAGESFDNDSFNDVATVMNEAAANADTASPMLYAMMTRERLEDPFIELRPWPLGLSMTADAAWRRMLGFGYFDKGSGLTPGAAYDYRVTGHFHRRDIEEESYGFHTIPLGTTLPSSFHLGPVRFNTLFPSRVELFPPAPPAVLTSTGRKGIALRPWGFSGRSLIMDFPAPVSHVVLEFDPHADHDIKYEAKTSDYIPGLSGSSFSDTVPALPRVEIKFPEPVDSITFKGKAFLNGIRIVNSPPGSNPDDIIPKSVNIYGARYEPTPPPESPLFLGTVNLQEPILAGDPALTVQNPPNSLGFRLLWMPPVSGSSIPGLWPSDLDAFPPFDVIGFHIERRHVDAGDPFVEVDNQDTHTLFFGNRGSRKDPLPLSFGIDLLTAFPEIGKPEPPISIFMDAEDVLNSAAKAGPPPGSLHQYRIFSVDAIGRRSAVARVGSIVRLEKRIPPPPPVGPTTPAPSPASVQPAGVRARLIQASDPQLTPADVALLGASANAVVLEWAWTAQERERDPFAKEFRVYWQPVPPDTVFGNLIGPANLIGGQYRMTANLNQPVAADDMKGRYINAGGYPFKVASHTAGKIGITINLHPSQKDSSRVPSEAGFEFHPVLDGKELRPSSWPERTAIAPITAAEDYQHIFRDRVTINATHPRAHVWAGVSAADDQNYIPDEVTTGPNSGRPGNESSIATATAKARYIGRPVFTVPPPLPDVPVQITDEPAGETVPVKLNLSALLPAVAIPAGHRIILERTSFDLLVPLIRARSNDTIGVNLPDGTTDSYTLGNPADQAAFLSQIRSSTPGRVEDRFLMDFLLRYPAQLERLWQAPLPGPVSFGTVTDTLPAKAERYVHRIRLVDAAGHASAGAAIAPQIVRVPSLRSPVPPEIKSSDSADDSLTVKVRARDDFDLKWVLLFAHAAEASDAPGSDTLEKPQLLRLPNRRDLYPDDGIRLRLRDGTLLSPSAFEVATGDLQLPDRLITATLTPGFDKRVAVWAVSMTRDGITSRFTGPRTALTGPAPLVVPALTVTAAVGSDQASWPALSVSAQISIERSTDGGASFTRVSPWLPETATSFDIPAIAPGARQYRLVLRGLGGRTATGPGVNPA